MLDYRKGARGDAGRDFHEIEPDEVLRQAGLSRGS